MTVRGSVPDTAANNGTDRADEMVKVVQVQDHSHKEGWAVVSSLDSNKDEKKDFEH